MQRWHTSSKFLKKKTMARKGARAVDESWFFGFFERSREGNGKFMLRCNSPHAPWKPEVTARHISRIYEFKQKQNSEEFEWIGELCGTLMLS